MTASAAEALATVRAAGGDVRIVGPERLKVTAPVPLPNDLVERLRAMKPELRLALLSEASSRPWAEALARLDPASPPCDISPMGWLRFIDDCGRFINDGWAARAEALGWGPLDLFGCDRIKPMARLDRAGLLWLLDGRELLALTRDTAVISAPSGGRLTFYRRQLEIGGVLAWELDRQNNLMAERAAPSRKGSQPP
jgi:hypothetical protein